MVAADLTRIRFVTDAQVSPDGRTIAFVVTTHAHRAVAGWRAAWKVEAPACGVRAYGLLFRAGECEADAE